MLELLEQKLSSQLQLFFDTSRKIKLTRNVNHTVNAIYSFMHEEIEYIVKILTRPVTSESEFYRIDKEVKLIRDFAMKKPISNSKANIAINVPVPKIIHFEKNLEKIGYKYYIMKKIPGKSLDDIWDKLSKQNKLVVVENLAQIIKGIHSVKFEMFGEIEDYDCPRRFFSASSYYQAQTRRATRLLGKANLLPIELVTNSGILIEKLLKKTNFTDYPVLLHNDLNLTNFILSDSSEFKIETILDFEWAFAGDPIVDLFNIEDDWLKLDDYKERFYSIYFDNKSFDSNNFETEKTIVKIVSLLETIALGWVHFHPTAENIDYVKDSLEKILSQKDV